MRCFAPILAQGEFSPQPSPLYSLSGMLCLLLVLYLPSLIALSQLRSRRLGDTAMALWALCIVVVPLVGSIAFWVVRPEPTGRVDDLAKAIDQFRWSLNDVVAAQRDAVQASRERTEEEAVRALTRQEKAS